MMRTSKSTYAILAAGVILGAVATAMTMQGKIVPKAIAQDSPARTIGNLSTENMSLLRDLNDSFASLADYIAPAVVHIQVKSERQTDMFGRRMPEMGGEGSGVIIRENGWIVTNDHVVGGASDVKVLLNDGREFPGKVTRSAETDLAVVKIDAKDLPTVQFADSNKVRPGQFAIAVGSPFGLENSVTIGHVSALGRESMASDPSSAQTRLYPDLIQTDAAINRGNSGGPLLDVEGRVIGINTVIYSTTGGNMGIGFAIPANQARLIAEMLIDTGKVVKGYLGVYPKNLREHDKKEKGVESGALVSFENLGTNPSPAKAAGLQDGDVITRIGAYQVTGQQDLRNAMYRYKPGETVTLEYVRNKISKTATVKLGAPLAPTSETSPSQPEPKLDGEGIEPNFESPDLDKFFRDMNPIQPKEGEGRVPPVTDKPRLGVQIDSITSADRTTYHIPGDVSGVIVRSIQSGTPASRIGLRVGDVILAIGGNPVRKPEEVTSALKDLKWGQTRQIKYGRYSESGEILSQVTVRF